MNSFKKFALIGSACLLSTQLFAETTTSTTSTPPKVPANSIVTGDANAKPSIPDVTITTNVQSAIKQSKVLSPLKVTITTENGVVHITGAVDASSEASLLVETAQAQPGVQNVDVSLLTVKGSHSFINDSLITAKVKGLFIQEELLGQRDIASINISVETTDGVVYLTGDVNNKQQIDNAIKIIQERVLGVKKVVYKVNQTASTM